MPHGPLLVQPRRATTVAWGATTVEFRLRNQLGDLPLTVDPRLNPEYGGLIIYIRRPDGRIVEYAPIMCKLATPEQHTLQPVDPAVAGADRYSESVFLSYGQYGFYFDQPGEYLVRALYQGPGDLLIPSNVHRVRVGRSLSVAEDRLAQDFFTYQVGLNLYLGGSPSPHLTNGLNTLREVAERYRDTWAGAKAALVVANSAAQTFFRVEGQVLTKTQSADPAAAVAITEPALERYRREGGRPLNLEYHQLVRARADWLADVDDRDRAREEVATARRDLEARGVNQVVLEELAAFAAAIIDGGARDTGAEGASGRQRRSRRRR